MLLCAWHARGCTCERARTPGELPAKQPAAPTDSATDDWRAGRLPPSVLHGTPRSGGQLVVGVDWEPPSLNAIVTSDWLAKRFVLTRIYQGLVTVDAADDPRYRIIPQLAERWEVSPDGRVYTFHLRPDVRWHDGEPFTARDVVATLDKVMDPQVDAASTRADFAELARYHAPDDHSVVLEWKRPYFLVLDALSDLTIQPAHVIARLGAREYNEAATNPLNRAPLGTGPFKFERWDSHSQIVLTRNPAYWGRPAYLERLVFRVVTDANVRLQLAERGELDLVQRVKTEQWTHMDSPQLRRQFNRSLFYASKYNWIGWNLARPPFGDVRVRRALTMLVDRPGIIDKLMYGLPRPTTCHFYYASSACDPSLAPLPFDPAAAAALLDEADVRDHDGDGLRDFGPARRPFRFSMSLPSTASETARIVTKIKEDLAHSGIDMQLEKVEWSAFLQRVAAHDFDAITLNWSGDARMDPTQIFHSSSIAGGSNYIGYVNPEADRLMEQARVTVDPGARDALYRAFGALLQRDQPYTFLFVPPELDLIRRSVRGARPGLYWWSFEDLWLAGPEGS